MSSLDNDSNCELLLCRLQDYRRLIHPSRLLLLHRRHFFLVWQHPDSRPIYIQLLVREQVQAMRTGLLSAQPAATWTGNRWINDTAYISLWGPGCRFTCSHLNDYRYMLERATHELCALLRIDNKPRRTLIHSLRIQRLAAIGTEEALASITAMRLEYHRRTKRLSNQANKERRRQRDSAQTNGEHGLPLNEQGSCFKTASPAVSPIGSSSLTIESNRHFPSRATRVPGVDTPTNQMSQTPGLGPGGGVRRDGRTHYRSFMTAAALSSGRNREDTPTGATTDQTPGPGPGGGEANLVRTLKIPDPPAAYGPHRRSPSSSASLGADARRQHPWNSARTADQTPGPGPGGGSTDGDLPLSVIPMLKPRVSFSQRHPDAVQVDVRRANTCTRRLQLSTLSVDQTPGPGPGGGTPRQNWIYLARPSTPASLAELLGPPDSPPRKRRAEGDLPIHSIRRLRADRRQQLKAESDAHVKAAEERRRPEMEASCPRGSTHTDLVALPQERALPISITAPYPGPQLPAPSPTDAVSTPSSSGPMELAPAPVDTAPTSNTSGPMEFLATEKAEIADEEEERVDYEFSPTNSTPSSPVLSGTNALAEILPQANPSSEAIAVNLAAGDDIPWASTGCQRIALVDIQHDSHNLTLRTSCRQSGHQLETESQHEIHEALVDALAQRDTSNAIYFLATHSRRADDSTVLTSLAGGTGIIAMCLLRSTSRSQSTRSQPHWSLDLVFTTVAFRSRGFCSALLQTAMRQAMLLLPGQVSARSSFTALNILTHAGFEQLGPDYSWLYRHCPLMPTTGRLDLTRIKPVSFCTDKRICYILSTIQIMCGQPGMLEWLLQQDWPHMKVGYSLTMLLLEYDPVARASTCVTLAVLHSHLVRRNKHMCGHSHHGLEDQDVFDLLLALLDCLDKETGSSAAPSIFRVDYEHAGTCAKPSCPDLSSVKMSDRAIRVWVPPSSTAPCRLESLLAQTMITEEKDFTCATCGHSRRKYSVAITGASRDVAICLQRATGEGCAAYHSEPVLLPTQLNLIVDGAPRRLYLRSVLLYCQVTGKSGVSDPHWLTVTHRRVQAKPQNPERAMWFLVSDDHVVALGDLGRHAENETLSLDHVALRKFGTLASCGAFYSSHEEVSLPRSLSPHMNQRHYAPTLDAAIESLKAIGVRVARCPWYACPTSEELRSRVASALFTNSPMAFKAAYLRKELAEVDSDLRTMRITLAKKDGVRVKSMDFRSSLDTVHKGYGHAEALDKGLQSPSLSGGLQFARELGNQLGVTLTNPAGIVVTTDEFVTGFHFHIFPVINTGIVTGAATADRSPWQTAGLFDPRVLKTYLFVPVATLELLGLSVADSGSTSLEDLVKRIARLPRSSRSAIQFHSAIMDGTETTHIVFPEQTLHWVATEASRGDSNAVYCGVGSYFLPNDIAAARRLRKSIEEYGHYRHTAKQIPSRSEALSLLDAHIATLGVMDPPASITSNPPPVMPPVPPEYGSSSDPALANEHSGILDSTILHA